MKLLRKKLFREIRQAKFRFMAIASVVAIGIILFTASYMAFLNLSASYDYTYDRLHFEDLLVRVDRAPERVVERLSELPNIKEITPRVSDPMGMELEDGTRVTGQIIGVPTTEPYVNMLHLREGRELTEDEAELTTVVEYHFAEFNDLQEGDIIEVPPTPLAWLGLRVREALYPLEPALRTYHEPTRVIRATDAYEDGFDNDSDGD